MSNELILLKTWIEKHSFDQWDTFRFFRGKTMNGVTINSVNTNVSESALDSCINDVRAAQKRKPANKGIKKLKQKQTSLQNPVTKI